jgi:hypothetical protein
MKISTTESDTVTIKVKRNLGGWDATLDRSKRISRIFLVIPAEKDDLGNPSSGSNHTMLGFFVWCFFVI